MIYTGFNSRNGAVILLVWTTNINYSGASFLYFTDLDFLYSNVRVRLFDSLIINLYILMIIRSFYITFSSSLLLSLVSLIVLILIIYLIPIIPNSSEHRRKKHPKRKIKRKT